jgi:hypothetical protein
MAETRMEITKRPFGAEVLIPQGLATEAKQDAVSGYLAALGYVRVAGPVKVTVDVTSKTLATLGLTLNSATKRLRIITPTEGIFWAYGTATIGSTPLLTGTNEEDGTPASFATLQFIVASGTVDMWVEELG